MDWLLVLPEDLEKGFEDDMATKTKEREKKPYLTIFERMGVEIGKEIGIGIGEERGEEKGQQGVLIRLIERKFGVTLPEEFIAKVKNINTMEQLDVLLGRILNE